MSSTDIDNHIINSIAKYSTIFKDLSSKFENSQTIFANMLVEFNNFMDAIKLHNQDISFEILKYLYYNSINQNYIINIINAIKTNLDIIREYYLNNIYPNIYNNTELYYLFIRCIENAIIIIYEYYYYNKYIYVYKAEKEAKAEKEEEEEEEDDENNALIKMIEKLHVEVKINSPDDFSYIDQNHPRQFLKFIVLNFNSEILKIPHQNDYEPSIFGAKIIPACRERETLLLSQKKQLQKLQGISGPTNKHLFLGFNINVLIYINTLLININETYKLKLNNKLTTYYITIPQYYGNCWFISIITGMSYSDKSRILLQSKIHSIDESTISTIDRSFFDFISYIISTISSKFKKYSSNVEDNCDTFINYKISQKKYIEEKYAEFTSNAANYEGKNIKDFVGSEDYYYYKSYRKKLTEPNKKIYDIGNNTFGYLILNSLYKIFNISTLYFYDTTVDDKLYTKKTSALDATTPDIIIIHNLNMDVLQNQYDSSSERTDARLLSSIYPGTIKEVDRHVLSSNSEKKIITYNDCDYELDYILHGSNQNLSCKSCGHCISGIHYNNEEYYYNSQYSQLSLDCNNNIVIIPCSLIRQDWSNAILEGDNEFCLKKCYHAKLVIDDTYHVEKDISTNNLCYTMNKDLIYVYVKKS